MYRRIEVVINTSELGAGTRGASLGPGAVMAAARSQKHSFFGDFPPVILPDFNRYLDFPVTTPYARYIEGYHQVFQSVAMETRRILDAERFPIILAGDHSSAAGTIAGIRLAHPDKRLGVVWIDAHADLHSPYTTPSGNLHGMPLALSLDTDHPGQRKNNPDKLTSELWEMMQHVGGMVPKIQPEHLVYVAVRDTETEENAVMDQFNIVNHTVSTVRTNGVESVIADIEQQLSACDHIYVSFDVDSMDPALTSFGTGTPVGNGITPDEARGLLTALAANPKTICLEMVEVNPCLDNKGNTMAETAFSLLLAFTNALNS